jgi:hypothetical protein
MYLKWAAKGGIRCLCLQGGGHFVLADVGGPIKMFSRTNGGPRTIMGNSVLDDLHWCRHEDCFKVTRSDNHLPALTISESFNGR